MKELVEHIRTVHFTILAVALILVAASGVAKKRPLQRAASDAEALLLLQRRWADVDLEIQKALDAAVPDDQATYWDGKSWSSTALHRPGSSYSVDVVFQDGARKHLRFATTHKWVYVAPTSEGMWTTSSSLPYAFSTLRQFLTIWDDFQGGNAAFVPLVLKTVSVTGAGYCAEAQTEPSSTATSWILINSWRSGAAWRLSPSLVANVGSPTQAQFTCNFETVVVSPLNIELGPAFAKVTEQAYTWRKARSAEAFGDLIAASKHLEETPLTQLVDVLRDRVDSDTERVELFQAKLPAETIPAYGSFLLIICQLYLLAHLYELGRIAKGSHFSEWPTGYIGLYDGRLTCGLTVVALAAPTASILRVAWSVTSHELYYFRWAAVGASGILSALTVWTLIVLRRSGPKVSSHNSVRPARVLSGNVGQGLGAALNCGALTGCRAGARNECLERALRDPLHGEFLALL